jgi:hypothetical protein
MNPERVVPMSTEKQFDALLNHTSNNVDNCFCLIIDKKIASLIGISEQILSPISAIVIIRHMGQHYIKGFMDGIYIESSTLEDLNADEIILTGVDCRKPGNNIIYYKTDNSLGKISSNLNMASDDSMNIFWECGPNACLTVCSYDPVREEVIREVATAENESTKKHLRSIVRQFINFSIPIVTQQIDDINLEDEFLKENPLNESTWL